MPPPVFDLCPIVERAARANKAGALRDNLSAVMAGLVPAIHVLAYCKAVKTWMP
jgi:hypothetical protein